MKNQTTFEAKLESLQDMMQWVREQIQSAGFYPPESQKIELALEEALVNVIHYAYGNNGGSIELGCSQEPQKIVFTIKDQGPPFNPLLQAPTVDHFGSLDEKKVGGLGILLIRHYMDEVRYDRIENSNVLTLTKIKANSENH